MINEDKSITTPEYWDKVYSGDNNDAKVDASNNVRPKNAFDRFGWVAKHAEGPNILGVASGHAHVEKRIRQLNPDWDVFASDQSEQAALVANFRPYFQLGAYNLFFKDKFFDTVILTQALEYIEDEDRFLREAARVGKKLLLTVPIGNMEKWSQLRIYSDDGVEALITQYGNIEVFEREGDLLLAKLKFS